jgi:hypothetical protein
VRTRDKLKVPVKAKCSGCGIRRVVADATVEAGTAFAFECKACGGKVRKTIYPSDIEKAIKEYQENKEYAARLRSGEVKITPSRSAELAPARDDDCSYTVAANATYGGAVAPKRVPSKEVTGASKLYHYAVYVRHPWGTDRIVVGVKKRNIQLARDEAWDRVVTKRKTGELKIMDAVPMKWTPNGIVETRKTTIKTGEYRNARRPKSRVSSRQRKAPAYIRRNKDKD